MINISGTTGCSLLMVAECGVMPRGRPAWVKVAFSYAKSYFYVCSVDDEENESMGWKMFAFIYLAEVSDKDCCFFKVYCQLVH